MNPFRLSSRVRPPPARVAGLLASEAAGAAVEVPWRVTERSPSGVIEVQHLGRDPAHSVRFALAGAGVLGLSLPGTVLPGERVRVVVRGSTADGCVAAPDAMLVLRWFEQDGREFLWPIALE